MTCRHFAARQTIELPGENRISLQNYQLSDTAAGPLANQMQQMAMEEEVQMIRPQLR